MNNKRESVVKLSRKRVKRRRQSNESDTVCEKVGDKGIVGGKSDEREIKWVLIAKWVSKVTKLIKGRKCVKKAGVKSEKRDKVSIRPSQQYVILSIELLHDDDVITQYSSRFDFLKKRGFSLVYMKA